MFKIGHEKSVKLGDSFSECFFGVNIQETYRIFRHLFFPATFFGKPIKPEGIIIQSHSSFLMRPCPVDPSKCLHELRVDEESQGARAGSRGICLLKIPGLVNIEKNHGKSPCYS